MKKRRPLLLCPHADVDSFRPQADIPTACTDLSASPRMSSNSSSKTCHYSCANLLSFYKLAPNTTCSIRANSTTSQDCPTSRLCNATVVAKGRSLVIKGIGKPVWSPELKWKEDRFLKPQRMATNIFLKVQLGASRVILTGIMVRDVAATQACTAAAGAHATNFHKMGKMGVDCAVVVIDGGDVDVDDCTFARNGLPAIGVRGGNVSINTSVFVANDVGHSCGGALLLVRSSQLCAPRAFLRTHDHGSKTSPMRVHSALTHIRHHTRSTRIS